MRTFVLLLALSAPFVWAQDMVRGKVDGKPVTQSQLEALIELVPQDQRSAMTGDPDELLRFFGFIMRMAEIAEKDKLAEMSPYKEKLEMSRKFGLAVAEMSEHGRGMDIPAAEVQKYYDEHKDNFTTINVTVAQVPVKSEADLPGAQDKAEALWKKLQAGADFNAMVKEYPVDGGFKSFKKSDAMPAPIKDAILQLKPGQVTKPVSRANGVFLIRLDSIDVKPLQDARGDVLKTMQDASYQKWMDSIRKSVVIAK
ncbi:MAG TPA: peptidylprolyl isomerase [Candidatus Solibacter sp.]|nr:peptidylprolyl isomerase [Candidatus Solibacter sp.]